MREIKKGTKFFVCDRDTLLEKGWQYDLGDFWHKEYPGNGITDIMLKENEFKILTVKCEVSYKRQVGWYIVEENYYHWPVSTFFAEGENYLDLIHTCFGGHEEGMTPINGWFICKNCGLNLKEIK